MNKVYKHEKSEGKTFFGKSKTQQHFADECNINKMLNRYSQTGLINQNKRTPKFMNLIGVPQYLEAQSLVIRAQEQFAGLPAEIRARFGHNPAQLLSFLDNESNRPEAIKLGLIQDPEELKKLKSAPSPT